MRKNVLILSSEFPPGPGGIGNQAYYIAEYLRKNNYNIGVYTSSRQGFDDVKYDSEHIELKISRYNTHAPLTNLFKAIKYIFTNRRKFDVALLSGNSPILLVFFIKLFCKWKVVAIIHAHEVLMTHGVMKQLTKTALHRVDAIIAVSEFAKSKLLENVKLRESKITVIPNGISMDRFNNKGHSPKTYVNNGKIKLVTIGSVTPRKGQINVVRALPAIKQKYNVEYHMVGIPKDKELIQDVARNLNVSDNIILHGALNDDDLYNVLSGGDIFFMLSENLPNGDVEGFGIAIIEANLVGLPAIGASGCGIDQAISNNYNGFLVNSKNATDILTCVDKIINDYQQFSKNALAWSDKHSWELLIKDYIRVIEN